MQSIILQNCEEDLILISECNINYLEFKYLNIFSQNFKYCSFKSDFILLALKSEIDVVFLFHNSDNKIWFKKFIMTKKSLRLTFSTEIVKDDSVMCVRLKLPLQNTTTVEMYWLHSIAVQRWRHAGGSLFTACILRFVSRSGFTQRPVVADLNGVKLGTSSGHTLSCQPHFPPVDQAAVPLFSPSNSFSISTSPSHYSHFSTSALPAQFWHAATAPPSPPSCHNTHTLRLLSAEPRADLLFKLMARYVKQTWLLPDRRN